MTHPGGTGGRWRVCWAPHHAHHHHWVISKQQGDMEDMPDQLGEWDGTLQNPTVTLD